MDVGLTIGLFVGVSLCKEKLLKPGWGGWEGKRGAQTMAGRCQSQAGKAGAGLSLPGVPL